MQDEISLPLNFNRNQLDAIFDKPNHSPQDILNLFSSSLQKLFDSSVGVRQNYTLYQHTLMVLNQYEKYFMFAPVKNKKLFEVILVLHDIGKPLAAAEGDRHRQHLHTKRLLPPILKQLNFTDNEIRLAEALTGEDPIGPYLKGGSVEKAAEIILQMTKNANLDFDEFWHLLLIYFQVDAGSYTLDAGGIYALDSLFVFSPDINTMTFAPDVKTKISLLEQEVMKDKS